MTSLNLPIKNLLLDDSQGRLIQVSVVGGIKRILKIFHIKNLHTGYVVRLNRKFGKVYLTLQGLLNFLEKNIDKLKSIPPSDIEALVSECNKIYFAFERNNYFDNEDTKVLSENILDITYSINRFYNQNYNYEKKVDDSDLIDFASEWSKANFHKLING